MHVALPSPHPVDLTFGSRSLFTCSAPMATLSVPACVPSPAEDADRLHHAFEGWGTDENLIITILAHRNAAQRKLIRQAYEEKYGENLLRSLDKELSQDFERAMLLWTLDPAERDAQLAKEAVLKNPPTNHVLIEIACTRGSMDLVWVRQAYQNHYKRSLEEDVAAHTKGNFRKLLVPLVSAYRYEGLEVNMTLAKAEAKKLHEDIKEKNCDHEETIRILTTRSKAQIRATLNHYMDQYGTTFEQDLEAESENAFLSTLKQVVTCLTCPEVYFEEVLRHAIVGLGTDEEALTRVVTTRAEVDMVKIKEQYYKRNTVTLDNAIIGDTSGDYKTVLLNLIGHGDA